MTARLRRPSAFVLLACLAAAGACAPRAGEGNRNAPAPAGGGPSGIERAADTTGRVPYDFVAADFVDASRGWIAGKDEGNGVSVVLRTEDGGATWTQTVEILGETLFDLDFADASNGWAVGIEGTIYRTADGGRTWTVEPPSQWAVQREEPFERVRAPDQPGLVLEIGETVVSFFFVDARNGWAAGDTPGDDLDARRRLLLRTSDGGRTWTEAAPAPDLDLAINDIFFVSPTEGWAAGGNVPTREEDVLMRTADGGATWERVRTGAAQYLRAVHFADPRTGWVVGMTIDPVEEALGPSRLLATTDGGRTWSPQLTVDRSMFDVVFVDASRGWAVGERATVYATADGGRTWTQQTRFVTEGSTTMNRPQGPRGQAPPRSLNSVFALSPSEVWVGGAGVILERK